MAETIQGSIDPFGRWNSQVSVDTFWKLPDRGLIGDSIELSFDLRFSCLSRAVIERYVELSTDELSIPIIPYTEDLWHKLINPLRLAKKSYAFGDFIATIALCELVAEMLALLTFEVYGPFSSGKRGKQGRALSFAEFEKYGQAERIRVLDQKLQAHQINRFKTIQQTRRQYLHFWSKDYSEIRDDARQSYEAAFQLLTSFLDPRN